MSFIFLTKLSGFLFRKLLSSLRAESDVAVTGTDGPPQWGGGRLFGASVGFLFTKTAVTGKRKVEKSILRCQIGRCAEGYKQAPVEIQICG